MQRKRFIYLLAILALLASMLPLAAAAQEAPTASYQIEEFTAPENKDLERPAAAGAAPFYAPDGMNLFSETEPNDTAATANALAGSQAVVYGNVSPANDVDYFSFSATAGDRVYAAMQTQWSNVSGDSRLQIIASDGTTVLEFDDDDGAFSSLASSIAGTVIPATGTYYVRAYGYSATTVITPYHLHVRVQSGTPTAEVEPNNTTATANPLPANGWVSGNMAATTDPDVFSFSLNAGDSVYLALDQDPGRATSNSAWDARLGLGLFGDAANMILVASGSTTTKPNSEAFFMTVQQAGTYYAYIDSTSATGLGANALYNLSVSIYPKATQQNCTTFTSSDVPKAIGPGVGTTTSTITVPGTVTSSITDINATIVLTHSLMADLDVNLVGPTGANVPLFTDVGAAATGGQIVMNVGLDDQAALPIGTFTVVAGMINQPEQPGRLASFNGTPATGTWTLQVADDLASNGGRLQSWSLEICGDPPPAYGVELNKTVGTVPAVCATTDSVVIPPGFDVYYCYTVRNTGLNTLTTHDLVDSELGTLFTGMSHSLAPGATYSYIEQATIFDTVTNTGTWTAHGAGGSASDSDTATVTVRAQQCPVGYQPVTLDATFFDNPFPPAGWTVTNTTTNCNAAGAVPEWTNTNPAGRVNLTGGVGPFAIADSDRCGSGSLMDTIMTTGSLDFSGMVDPTVSFNNDYYDLGVGVDFAYVDASTDGGTTWNNLITWDTSHRGPLLVTQALTGAAGQSDVQVRWHYVAPGWRWWWQVDDAFITACAPIPSNPAITLDKTVGTDPTVCAATDQITVAAGTDVTYCYEVTNTGDVSFNTHDLVDSELGALLTNYPYTLTPGASAFLTQTATINVTTVNTATWTASTLFEGGGVSASDVATVTVMLTDPNISVDPLSMASTQPPNVQMQQTLTISNTGGGTLNWSIVEEPASAPPAAAPENVTGSTLSAVAPTALMPGVPTTLSFTARFVSPDLEYGDRFDVDLPDGWTIGAVSANSSPVANGCSSAIPPVSGVAAGNVVYWQSKSTLPTGCGAWSGGSAGTDFTFTVEVTAPSCSGAPWNLPWNIIGDGWGAAPHSVSGTFSSMTCGAPPVCSAPSDVPWLSLAPTSGATAGGGSTPVTVDFDSTGMAAGTYNANLCVTSDDPDPGPGNETDLVIVPVTMTVTQPLAPNIDVSPLSLSETHATPPQSTSQTLTVANTGGGTLTWSIAEEPASVLVQPNAPNAAARPAAAGATGSRGSSSSGPAPLAYSSPASFSEGFDDITNLPGWYMQNNSSPLGLTDWFQGNDTVFPAQAGAPTAYIGANFNNTSGTGTISNWLLTPQLNLSNGDTFSFWTRTADGSIWADRLQVRLSTAGASTNVGTLATDVGDFTTLLLDVNSALVGTGYPQSWTQYTVTLSGIPANASGRLAFRYFVTDGGPSGNNSNYIGIDTVEFTSAGGGGACSAPADVPWLSLAPTSGATAGGGSTPVTVTFNSTGLAVGVYNANLCVDSNDPDPGPGNGTDLVVVPVTLTVEESQPGVFACNMPAEGFDGGVPPAGWAVQTNEPNGPQWTTIALSGETGNYTNGTGEAASVSSDAFGTAEMDTSLVTPAFDLTGFGTASLNYTANYQNYVNSDYLDVDISTDGGATWTNLLRWNEDHGTFGAPPGVDVNLDLSAYAGQSGLMLRYRYYDPNSGDWNWYAQVDNVGLSCGQVAEEPNIDVSPLSMSSTQPPNATTQQQLNVGNTGTANLTWMIDEEPARPTAAPAPSVVSIDKLGAPAAVQRSAKELQDLLNSPTADVVQDGSFEAGTPSPFWTEASTNFGTPLCDVPGCGTGTGTGPLTGDWWAWFGGIAAYEAGSVSQSVTIPSGGPATLSFWVEQFVCSGDAADYLEVNMDGTQLWATTAADPACGTLGYRQVTLDVSAYANGGAHTLEFSSEVFGSDTTNFFVDDVMLDAQSGPVVCAAPSNVPWLSVNPTNGTTAPAASTPVQVTFDSTGLAVGVYNANLCVDSNDPDAGPGNGTELVVVPVELIVEGAASITVAKTVGTVPGVCAATSTIEVLPGTTVYYCYTVTNTGDVTLYSHTLVDDQLGTLFTNLAYALAPGASVSTVTLGQSFPAVITMPTTNVGTWTAAQSSTGGLSATASGTAFVDVIYFGCRNPEEDFENGVPTWGWSVVNNAGGASWGNIAACGPNGDGGNFTGGLGDAACMSPSSLTGGAYDSELRTPVFSLVGYSEATFSYLANYQNWAGIDRLNFDISADGGVTWTTLRTWNSDQGAFQNTPGVFPTVDLAAYLGQSNLMLRWHYFWNNSQAMGWYAQVDEAEFKCVQAPPTAVTLDGLSAVQAPLPVAGLPLAALPAVVSMALGAAYVLRRKE